MVFNQSVKRNAERFPPEFRFQLTKEEFDRLTSQFVISNFCAPTRLENRERGRSASAALENDSLEKYFLRFWSCCFVKKGGNRFSTNKIKCKMRFCRSRNGSKKFSSRPKVNARSLPGEGEGAPLSTTASLYKG